MEELIIAGLAVVASVVGFLGGKKNKVLYPALFIVTLVGLLYFKLIPDRALTLGGALPLVLGFLSGLLWADDHDKKD